MAESSITIEYSGGSQAAAEELRNRITAGGLSVEVNDRTPAGGELGVPELVIAFVATGLAKAASKVALGYLRQYLKERIQSGDRRLRVRVVIQEGPNKSTKLPFSLEKATLETIESFCGQVEKAIDAI
jgi:hypothetical protein